MILYNKDRDSFEGYSAFYEERRQNDKRNQNTVAPGFLFGSKAGANRKQRRFRL